MSTEEVFFQQFAKLFVHYRDALTLDASGESGRELQKLNEIPSVELDRMVSAGRLALLEIETKARGLRASGQYDSDTRPSLQPLSLTNYL